MLSHKVELGNDFFVCQKHYTQNRENMEQECAHTYPPYRTFGRASVYTCVWLCMYDVECYDAYFNGTNTIVRPKIARRTQTISDRISKTEMRMEYGKERFIHQMQSDADDNGKCMTERYQSLLLWMFHVETSFHFSAFTEDRLFATGNKRVIKTLAMHYQQITTCTVNHHIK